MAPLTARSENMPSEHDGSEFTFDLHFSESPEDPYRRLRDRSFTLVQADVIRAKRQNPQATNKNQRWTITVDPLGMVQIGITLPAAVSCTDEKSICTHDGRKLNHSTSATIAAPPVELRRRRDGHRGRRRGPRLHGVAQPQLQQPAAPRRRST